MITINLSTSANAFYGRVAEKKSYEDRSLSEETKFVQKRRNKAVPDIVSTFIDCYMFNDKIVIYYNVTDKKSPVPEGVRIRTIWWSIRDSNP